MNQDAYLTYNRERFFMGQDEKEKKDTENKNNITLNINGKEFKISFKVILSALILPLALSLFSNFLYGLWTNSPNKFKILEEDIGNIKLSLGQMETRLSNLESYSNVNNKEQPSTVINNNYYTTSLRPVKDGVIEIDDAIEIQGIVEVACLLTKPSWSKSEKLAINKDTNDTYTAEDLKNEKIFLPYREGNQEVLFYGQYDDSYNWNKDCIINVYENDKLILISETVYESGIPLSSKLVYPYETKGKVDVWCITDRKYDEQLNSIDETWNYFEVDKYSKTFDLENTTIDDLQYISQFENDIKESSSLEGYYRDIIDGNSKKSYMIKNDKNGFIRTLYIGEFENGDFQDQTGNAEEIVFDETVNKYFYYTGTFTKGRRDSDNDLEYKTQDEINEIIKPYKFNCELNWYDTKKDTD